jgi:hypothetical protein
MKFKPFCDYFASWFPPGCTDKDYIIAQYDGAIAYMDACIANIFADVGALGLSRILSWSSTPTTARRCTTTSAGIDHHGIYDNTLHIPLFFYFPGVVPAGVRFTDYVHMKDIMPTILDLLGIKTGIKFDGRSLVPLFEGKPRVQEPEYYITECTWMRKHGWRTPEWKYIHALEPDFHFKPEIELYNLAHRPRGEQQPGGAGARGGEDARGCWPACRLGSRSVSQKPGARTRSTPTRTGTVTGCSSKPPSRPTTRCTSARRKPRRTPRRAALGLL